jgi:cysteine desulfuration protein SufE
MDSVADLIEDFAMLDDWEDRYRLLIEMGQSLPALPDEDHQEGYRVLGCTSRVWMKPMAFEGDPRRFDFLADSDSALVKGLIAVLHRVYAGLGPEAILAKDIQEIFETLGLAKHLSPSRSNGFFSMVQKIQDYARAMRSTA